MRHLLPVCLLCGLFLGAARVPALASHLRGGDLTYTSVASPYAATLRYHLRLRIFTEPTGSVSPAPTVQVAALPSGCSQTGRVLSTLTLVQSTAGPTLNCSTGSAFYSATLYESDIDLPVGQWLLTYAESARNASIQNIPSASSTTFCLSAYLDNTLAPLNNSPRFESALQPYASTTIPPYSFSTYDADGDSLRYEFMLPLTGCNQPATGATVAPHFQLNATTGAISTKSATWQAGMYDMGVKVSEYRRLNGGWQLIGSVMRETVYVLASSTNQPPTFSSIRVNTGAAQPLGQLIQAQRGQPLLLTLAASDPDAGQQLRFASEINTVVPGLTTSTVNGQLHVLWNVPATLPSGLYTLAVAVLDDGCPYNASEEQTLLVRVSSQPLGTRPAAGALAPAYPTPFREQVQFIAPAGQPVLVSDALGRPVARLTAGPDGLVRWLPADALPAGLYLARTADTGALLARLLRAE